VWVLAVPGENASARPGMDRTYGTNRTYMTLISPTCPIGPMGVTSPARCISTTSAPLGSVSRREESHLRRSPGIRRRLEVCRVAR
jgi:hypothetical protein